MQLNDEIITPGCPNCAIKHLSTAIALLAVLKQKPESDADSAVSDEFPLDNDSRVLVAQARINVDESFEGYESHSILAIGLLSLAESSCVASGFVAAAKFIRTVRLEMMQGRAQVDMLSEIVNATSLWQAHQREAMRELPGFDWDRAKAQYGTLPVHEYFQHCISDIRKEYFETPETPEKGGEDTMATKKKPAFLDKKAAKKDPKAKQAASKGGCCKGKKCK